MVDTRNVAGGIEITAAVEPEEDPVPMNAGRLATLAWHGVPLNLHASLAHGDLESAVASTLRIHGLAARALPTADPVERSAGSWEALTAVRLATRLVMGGVTPMVITTDAKRAGATEQFAAFTRILGLPLLVVSHPEHPRPSPGAATRRCAGVDRHRRFRPSRQHPGRGDPRTHRHSRRACRAGASGRAHPAEASDLAIAHAECGAVSLIATRLDLARRMGGVVAAAAASQLVLAEAGIGPDAADGMVPFTPSLLAERLGRSEGRNDATLIFHGSSRSLRAKAAWARPGCRLPCPMRWSGPAGASCCSMPISASRMWTCSLV